MKTIIWDIEQLLLYENTSNFVLLFNLEFLVS